MTDSLQRSLYIQAASTDYRKNTNSGGGPLRSFGDPEAARHALLQQCDMIQAEMAEDAEEVGAAPAVKLGLARLVLKPNALAKSYRPVETFTEMTCPIIGDGDAQGELLVLVTNNGLEQLRDTLHRTQNKQTLAHWTSIDAFTLNRRDRRFPERERRLLLQRLAAGEASRLKISLLRFGLFASLFQDELQRLLSSIPGIDAAPYLELGAFSIYGATIQTMEQALAIAAYPFIERIALMPRYRLSQVRLQEMPSMPMQVAAADETLPIVAVVDGGIEVTSPLESLVWDRDVQVLPSEADVQHGTAVAALVAAQNDLRTGTLIPRSQLLDVRMMKRDEEIDEDLFKAKLHHAVERFGKQVTIWNLSLAARPGQHPTEFSDLGRYLERLQREYSILFCIAAGNCPQMRQWPYTIDDHQEEWIAVPGDTPGTLTVGAYAPDDAPPDAYAPDGCPSPFTPHGPGPYSTPKPNVSALGGNVTHAGVAIGVPTMGANGGLVEMIGTSMAAPNVAGLASELLACIRNTGVPVEDELLLLRALLMHRAIRSANSPLGSNTADFYGLGKLNSLEDTLGDPFWQSTMLISMKLYPDQEELRIDPFPYPRGLWHDGHFQGEMWLTMVSDPLVEPERRREYVRSDVEIGFTCYKQGEKEAQFHLSPLDIGRGYEASRIKNEHKWSPIKQYHGKLPRAGMQGDAWRLQGKLLLRERESYSIRQDPSRIGDYGVKIVIALTILDPLHAVEVSNQMVQQWRARGNQTLQLEVAQRIRAKFSA